MTAHRDLEHQLAAFYSDEGQFRAPDRVLAAALTTIEDTPQRRVLSRVPWRIPDMTATVKLGATIAVVAAVAIGLFYFFNKPSFVGPGASPSPIITPLPPSLAPSPTASATQPALSQQFTSDIHGFSMSYPAGWSDRAATEPWSESIPLFEDPFNDVMYDDSTEDLKFIGVASQALAGRTASDWITETSNDPKWEPPCPPQTSATTIDGADGALVTYCPDGVLAALATVDERGYLFVLYGVGDRDWFEEILATVQLAPQDAKPTPQ